LAGIICCFWHCSTSSVANLFRTGVNREEKKIDWFY
jgi:hypothetical protein